MLPVLVSYMLAPRWSEYLVSFSLGWELGRFFSWAAILEKIT